jgi:hypothetical protein
VPTSFVLAVVDRKWNVPELRRRISFAHESRRPRYAVP